MIDNLILTKLDAPQGKSCLIDNVYRKIMATCINLVQKIPGANSMLQNKHVNVKIHLLWIEPQLKSIFCYNLMQEICIKSLNLKSAHHVDMPNLKSKCYINQGMSKFWKVNGNFFRIKLLNLLLHYLILLEIKLIINIWFETRVYK